MYLPHCSCSHIVCSCYLLLIRFFFIYSYVKGTYLESINRLAPGYLIEKYSAVAKYLAEDNLQQGGTCVVDLECSPFHNERPGLSIYYSYKKLWQHISRIEGIYAINISDGFVKLDLRENRDSYEINITDTQKLDSFVSCIVGYYRLMCKWAFNLISHYASPSLLTLTELKCHGPIGGEFSYLKLQQQQSSTGSYLIRQCEKVFDTYYIDIIRTKLVRFFDVNNRYLI